MKLADMTQFSIKHILGGGRGVIFRAVDKPGAGFAVTKTITLIVYKLKTKKVFHQELSKFVYT